MWVGRELNSQSDNVNAFIFLVYPKSFIDSIIIHLHLR